MTSVLDTTTMIAVIVAFVGIAFLWGLFRGLAKTRLRTILILVSAAAAVISTLIAKQFIASEDFVNDFVVPLLEYFQVSGIDDLLGMSATLNEVLLGCIGAMFAPILCLAFFLVYSVITWIVFAIISLVMHSAFRRQNERSHLKLVRVLILTLVHALIVVAIYMIPISVYSEIAPLVVNEIAAADVMDAESEDAVQQIVDDYVEPLNENPIVIAYRSMGGDALCELVTDFEVKGVPTHLEDEVGAVSSFGCNVFRLTQTKFENYSSREAGIILAIADSFDNSELLPTIVGEVIYNASEAWLKGEDFLGVQKPDAGELFDPFFDALLRVLHNDSKNTPALQKDIRTLAEMVSTLAKHEIFAHLSDIEALMAKLDGAGAVNELITVLGSNDSMKVLIPEITNLGIRAIASTLGIPADTTALYDEFMTDVADILNEVKALDEQARVERVTTELQSAFETAGIEIEASMLDCYSVSMVNDLVEQAADADITAEDVQAFFILYAMNALGEEEEEAEETEDGATDPVGMTGTFPLTEEEKNPFAGTIYENMTEEELANTGAAVLANVLTQLTTLTTTDPAQLSQEVSSIVRDAYGALLSDKQETLDAISNVQLTEALSTELLNAATGLQSPDAMAEVTQRVTLEKLLINVEDASQNITSETIESEVKVIDTIFSAATELLGKMENPADLDLTTLASSVGQVLDALNQAGTFGEEKTSDLFKAVLQSEQVRTNTNMDMATATKLADKATEGNVDYVKTMQTVSGSVSVVTKLGNGETIDESELTELIQTLTPQTAGMIEVYVTPSRVMGYGVPEQFATTSSKMIAAIFGYLAEDDVADFDAEAKALNQMLTISMAAKDNAQKQQPLFGGILPSAEETVSTLLGSKAIGYSLTSVLTDGSKVTQNDPFGLAERMPANSVEETQFVNAIRAYHQAHPETNVLVLEALAATFGITMSFN
ncbi:MAG: hypothetical protein IJX28_01550 [Clostridia bacterium]|nr:hypothetical protein [Clostridia bacterium]